MADTEAVINKLINYLYFNSCKVKINHFNSLSSYPECFQFQRYFDDYLVFIIIIIIFKFIEARKQKN
jgi:hypothetical protein